MNRTHAQWTAFGIVVALLLAGGGYAIGKWNQVPEQGVEEFAADEVTDKGELPPTENEVPTGLQNEPRTMGDITFEIKEMNENQLLAPYKSAMVEAYKKIYGTTENLAYENEAKMWNDILLRSAWYEVGEITGEESQFKGQKLLMFRSDCDGPCFYSPLYRFAFEPQTGTLTFFKNMSAEWIEDYFKPLTQNSSNVILQELALPQTIALPEGKDGVLTFAEGNDFINRAFGTAESLGYGEVIFDSSYGPIYGINGADGERFYSSAMYLQAPDGTWGRYELKSVDFTDTLFDRTKNLVVQLSEYRFPSKGCGIMGNAYTVEDITEDQLVVLGTTLRGYTLYEVKNPSLNAVSQSPDNEYTWIPASDANNAQVALAEMYWQYKSMREAAIKNNWNIDTSPIKTWDEYLATHPLLYFKDAFGRFGAVAHSDFAPVAECGKPVIYLYPTEEMEVNVQVDVDEFTKTVPEYGENGWTVKATPKGKLANLADGETYPYLFWEAKDDDAVSADQGFMVERKKVDRFLRKALKQMGFTRKEMKDFMEFWKPRILDNPEPYFFISFLGTQDFNKVAPLTITPAPDTLIRVFMYYDPVSTPFDVIEQKLSSTPRRGFTVFEWGGTSSRPWVEDKE